jgi:hypothetical protein
MAREMNVAIVTPKWVFDTWDNQKIPPPEEYYIPPFQNCIISMTEMSEGINIFPEFHS